jgi:hypothetical protein
MPTPRERSPPPTRGRAALRGISPYAEQNADWHRLLEICGLSGTLICDEDGLYDPTDFNDRMLLGMKGQLSEALCRGLHKASYADLGIMPTVGRKPLLGTVSGPAGSA